MKIILPLFVMLPRKTIKDKKIILNLNVYRNLHHRLLNDSKILYRESIRERVKVPIKKLENVSLIYTYYAPTKRKFDISNPCSIIDKYTCDALTSFGFWEDDNIDIIKSVKYKFGGVDSQNPRCELLITHD